MSTTRTRFEAGLDKSANRKAEEAAGNVADSMDVRLAIVERISSGAITLEQGQAELKRIKAGAAKAGKITRAQAYSRG